LLFDASSLDFSFSLRRDADSQHCHMKASLGVAIVAVAVAFSGCASEHLPSSVHAISLAPEARRAPVVLAPTRAAAFTRMANERDSWAANQLRSAIARELVATGRFQAAPAGGGDAEISIETLRHGLIEVSANSYAVTVSGAISINQGAKSLGQREFSATGGDIRPVAEFEEPQVYEAALQGAFDKVALELVTAL
jgi:hypothetical protein